MRRKRPISDYVWAVLFAIIDPEPILMPGKRVCDPKDSTKACSERLRAVRSGEMRPDKNLGAWIFPEDPRRRITVEMKISGLYEHDLDPYSWLVCPWCGNELPSVYSLNSIDCGNSD